MVDEQDDDHETVPQQQQQQLQAPQPQQQRYTSPLKTHGGPPPAAVTQSSSTKSSTGDSIASYFTFGKKYHNVEEPALASEDEENPSRVPPEATSQELSVALNIEVPEPHLWAIVGACVSEANYSLDLTQVARLLNLLKGGSYPSIRSLALILQEKVEFKDQYASRFNKTVFQTLLILEPLTQLGGRIFRTELGTKPFFRRLRKFALPEKKSYYFMGKTTKEKLIAPNWQPKIAHNPLPEEKEALKEAIIQQTLSLIQHWATTWNTPEENPYCLRIPSLSRRNLVSTT
eukprot:TRINITY_DN5852_c0_g1_i1.p1 TRINITY_DN5852_c0_g1~~TRINITY_DN5852_c0_g1_i1.p1  ORF type:complete len:288 (-),score=79.53 TRINITY_DN5852_c0_g1_i1:622-1485(-)